MSDGRAVSSGNATNDVCHAGQPQDVVKRVRTTSTHRR